MTIGMCLRPCLKAGHLLEQSGDAFIAPVQVHPFRHTHAGNMCTRVGVGGRGGRVGARRRRVCGGFAHKLCHLLNRLRSKIVRNLCAGVTWRSKCERCSPHDHVVFLQVAMRAIDKILALEKAIVRKLPSHYTRGLRLCRGESAGAGSGNNTALCGACIAIACPCVGAAHRIDFGIYLPLAQ